MIKIILAIRQWLFFFRMERYHFYLSFQSTELPKLPASEVDNTLGVSTSHLHFRWADRKAREFQISGKNLIIVFVFLLPHLLVALLQGI